MAEFTDPQGLGQVITSSDQLAPAVIQNQHIVNLTADKITAGTIDASKINVININASNITTGTLTAITINGGAAFVDTLGTFYPVVISSGGDVTVNSSTNHPTSLVFHNTANAGSVDTRFGSATSGVNMMMAPNTTSATAFIFEVADRRTTGSEYGLQMYVAAGGPLRLRSVAGGATSTFYDSTSVGTFYGDLQGTATTATNATKLNSEKIQRGTGTITLSTGRSSASQAVTFSSAFAAAPTVVVCLTNATASTDLSIYATSVTTTGFTVIVWNEDTTQAGSISYAYIAVGTA